MKLVDVRGLRAGERVAKPVMSGNGLVMLEKGAVLTEKYIERLKKIGVASIYIEDHPDSALQDQSPRGRHRRQSKAGNGDEYQIVTDAMQQFMESSSIRERISMPMLGDRFRKRFQDIMDDLSTHEIVVENMSKLYVKDPYLFHHSLNVAILSGIIGIASHYSPAQLYELVTSALLFDIGMQHLPDDLLKKRGSFTDEERALIEKHTHDGYDMLKGRNDLPFTAAICALQHHERYDGSGYPRGTTHHNIHEFAQIIAIADIYDALISARYHRKKYTPNEAIEFLFGSGNRLFNLKLVKLFTRYVSIYPVGSKVILSSGQVGVISYVDAAFVHRPVIRVIRETDGQVVAEPYEVDLKEQLGLTIVDTVS